MTVQQAPKCAAALLVALALAACGGSAAPATAPATAAARPPAAKPAGSAGAAIKIAYPTPGAVVAPLWLAQDDGIFKQYGLTSELLYTQPPNDTQALLNGDVQFNDDGSGGVNARLGGGDIVYIGVTAPYFVLSLYGGPNIHQVSDLWARPWRRRAPVSPPIMRCDRCWPTKASPTSR